MVLKMAKPSSVTLTFPALAIFRSVVVGELLLDHILLMEEVGLLRNESDNHPEVVIPNEDYEQYDRSLLTVFADGQTDGVLNNSLFRALWWGYAGCCHLC